MTNIHSKIKNSLRPYFVLQISLIIVTLVSFSDNVYSLDPSFTCGGNVENEVWSLWDTNVKKVISERFVNKRLLSHGDVYALYDFQTYTHNLVAMARRCKRITRLREVAGLIETTYSKLEPSAPDSSGRQWVCRGGTICNEKNGLLYKEVPLASIQFLGVATSVANALATSKTSLTDADKIFIRETVQISIEHLKRWSDKTSVEIIRKSRMATSMDVRTGSSSLLFTDKPLWMLSIYAEVAGILNSPQLTDIPKLKPHDKLQLSLHLSELFQFFQARISIQNKHNTRLGFAPLADLDRGFWRRYADNRYSGYVGTEKPVRCASSDGTKDKLNMTVAVPVEKVPKREDIGWDISHARRLVHALDSLERNRLNLIKVFSLKDDQYSQEYITRAFANTLVEIVWNGSERAPLFSNYWSGANGWYRVAYDDGTGQCREGIPPFGLTDSFPTGGYVIWAKYNSTVGVLGKQLYSSLHSSKPEDTAFITHYYSQLRTPLGKIMFFPSLVGVQIK
jgi:hypothetical protein